MKKIFTYVPLLMLVFIITFFPQTSFTKIRNNFSANKMMPLGASPVKDIETY